MDIFLNPLIQICLNSTINLLLLTAHIMLLYPQNGDRVVTVDCVASLHSVYIVAVVQVR